MNAKTRPKQRSIDSLRESADEAREALDALADALADDSADAEAVARTYREMTYAMVEVEDAAEGVIDADEDRWRVIDDLRASMHHAAHAIEIDESDDELLAPTADGCRSEALKWTTSAAEYLEADR